MNLKQLLNQSDREQVNLNLAPAPIAGRELRAGQYSVAVQRVPDASQTNLGKLANALGQVSPLIAKYGQMKIAETDLQNQAVDDTLAGMSPEDKEKLMRSTEEQIIKKLGGDYELNSVATIRTKKLIGAEYTTGFTPYLQEKLAEFSATRVKENGDKPSPLEVSEEINRITQEYIGQNPQISENQLMQAGFFEQASPIINKFKQTVPGQLAEQHKTETLMPNISSSLVRFAKSDDVDPKELAAFWEGNTRFLSPSEQKKILDETAAVLNFEGSEENLDAGIAFYESMRIAGVQIGNQPIDADDPKADNEYTRRIQDLEDKREAVQADDLSKHQVKLKVFGIESTSQFSALEARGLDDDSEEVFALKEKLKKEIDDNEEIPTKFKDEYKEEVELAELNGFLKRTKEINTLTGKFAQSKGNLTPAALRSSIQRDGISFVEQILGIPGASSRDVEELVQTIKTQSSVPGNTDLGNLQVARLRSGLLRIVNDADTRYLEIHGETMEEVAALERAGETVELGGKTYEISEGKDVEREKLRISSEYLVGQRDILMDQVKADIDEVVNNSKKRAEEERAAQEKQRAAEQTVLNKQERFERSKKAIVLGDPTVTRVELGGAMGAGLMPRPSVITEANPEGLSGTAIRQENNVGTALNMSDFAEALSEQLNLKSNPPEVQKETVKRFTAETEKAVSVYREAFNRIQTQRNQGAFRSNPTLTPDAREAINKRLDQDMIRLKYEVFNNRRIAGLSTADAKTLLRTRYFPEGARVATPIEFLKGELTGLGPDSESSQPYKSSMLIKGATDEELKELADKIGVDYERLKAAQSTYKNYLDGDVPQKAEPVVFKSEPTDPAQLELDLTRTTPPAPEATRTTQSPVAPVSTNARQQASESTGTTDTPKGYREEFLLRIRNAESDHGDTPSPTKDAREARMSPSKRSKDVGYGHKVSSTERKSGKIHGIPFKDDKGNYIPLTEEQKQSILSKDLAYHVSLARKRWDDKLAEIGTSWEELDAPYREVLSSLAFNVGGNKAGSQWKTVLNAAKNKDVRLFAKEIRRKDNDRNTRGMDNRAAKELYAAGLIKDLSEVKESLPLADQFK